MKCNHDCLNCKYEYCISSDKVTREEYLTSESVDREVVKDNAYDEKINSYCGKKLDRYLYNQSHDGKLRTRVYNSSEKAKECRERYNHSDKGNERTNRYNHSEKGIASRSEYESHRVKRKHSGNQIPYSDRKEYYHELYLKRKAAKSC